jgi:hypothetical protein
VWCDRICEGTVRDLHLPVPTPSVSYRVCMLVQSKRFTSSDQAIAEGAPYPVCAARKSNEVV